MRLLVTGGAGFIGSTFIRYVLGRDVGQGVADTRGPGQSGPGVDASGPSTGRSGTDGTGAEIHVTNVDALTYAGNLGSLADVAEDPRYRFVHGDVCDPALMEELATGADAIVHFAAESHVDRSITGPAPFLRTNVSGAGVVFEAARRAGVERVLHVSTDEVYGSIDPPGRFLEGDALEPNSPYAASKASADLLARAYARTHGLAITITRSSNTFGPFHHPEKLIPRFVTNLIDDQPVPLYGDGRNVRDWTFVADNVAAQWLVLTRGEAGGIYNIGAGNELTNEELTRAILARFGQSGADADARIDHVPDRPGHDRRYALDTTRIRELGWAPTRDVEDALDDTVAWYRTHEDWWRPLRDADAATAHGSRG